jgi:acetyl esterase/lipase
MVLIGAVAARIYEEVVKHRSPEAGPGMLAFWTRSDQFPLDLSRFYNNDGVASEKGPSDTNFDCPDHPPDLPGSGYPAERLPAGGSVFAVEEAGCQFVFPVVAFGETNNVACGGQRLSGLWPELGDEARLTEMVVLGAAENGSARADVKFEHADGAVRAVPLSFSDWCVEPAPGEIVAVSAPYRYAWDGRQRKNVRETITCRLFVRRLKVPDAGPVAAIILPEQPNLHIFAITFRVAPPDRAIAVRADRVARKYREAALLAEAPPADLTDPVGKLAEALAEAEGELSPHFARQFVWLKTRHEYVERRLEDRIVRRGSYTEHWARKTVGDIRSDLAELLDGRDPFAGRRGELLKGYVSDIDGRIQPYALYVPDSYRPTAPVPLVVHMHGHGWYRPFQGVPAPRIRDAIVLSPHGRGSMDYMFVGEEDVLACIEEVKKDYRIDPDRVYLTGHSMGGTGCWSLATKYPDRFAAIGPSAANADSKAWRDVGAKHARDDGSYAWLRERLRESLDPVTCAPNLLHVPSFFLHGEKDKVVPVENSRSMARALREAGCPFVYRSGKNGGHSWRPKRLVSEQRNYLFDKSRKRRPERVRLVTGYLKYGRAYWLRVLAFDRWDAIGEVEAAVRGEALIDVETGPHVTALELDLARCPKVRTDRALAVVVNTEPVFTGLPPPDGRLMLARSEAGWEVSEGRSGLRKRPYLEGPVSDAYTRSFLMVIGTESRGAVDRWMLWQEAERFARDWERMYTKRPRVTNDVDVTETDIAAHNLILYGGPGDNRVTARVADRLPVRVSGGAVEVGGRRYAGPGVATLFCYPNPLNPDRLVVVLAGARRARDVFQANNRFGNWFQWGPYDNRMWFDYAVFDRKTRSAETCLEFGFFGSDWGFRRETTWFGDAVTRDTAVERHIPRYLTPPDGDVVYLSDLVPESIEQHKLPVGFDTSAEGRELTIGHPDHHFRRFERGLGVRAPSTVRYLIRPKNGPGFERFKATVGVDLEGEVVVPPWRKKREWVKFLVYGDGALLYQTGMVRWDSRPVRLDVPVVRVRKLELVVWCTHLRWLVGSAAWGDARLERGRGEGAP